MKDPCLECLVQVTCWQECDKKRNHAALLAQAMRECTPGGRPRPEFHKQYRRNLDQTSQHLLTKSKINKRARSMSEDN